MRGTPPAPIFDVIDYIIDLNNEISNAWCQSHGWAPPEAAELLAKSRLDWQVSLSYSLRRWIVTPSAPESDGVQILAYANIGCLAEGTLKLFLAVYYETYKTDINAIRSRSGNLIDPDELMFNSLRQFFKNRIWGATSPSDNWDPWLERIQQRRNAIHAFRHRNIGIHSDIEEDIRAYYLFLNAIYNRLPPAPERQY
jgi:hypothetical protein